MRKKNVIIFLIVFLIIFLTNCGNSKTNIPENILSREKMRAILIDIHLLEGKISESGYANNDTAIFNYTKESDIIWKKHKIDSVRFRKSFKYYSENTKVFAQIYQEIIDSLSLKEVKAKAKENPVKKENTIKKENTK